MTECPHCGRPGICPPGSCLVRDRYDRTGLKAPNPPARKASAAGRRKMPAVASRSATPAKAQPKVKPKTYSKREILDLWQEAGKADRTLTVNPIPADHHGSRLHLYTIRISGRLSEIKATLGKLKTLLRYESGKTRLDLKLSELTEKDGPVIAGSWACYIQVHARA